MNYHIKRLLLHHLFKVILIDTGIEKWATSHSKQDVKICVKSEAKSSPRPQWFCQTELVTQFQKVLIKWFYVMFSKFKVGKQQVTSKSTEFQFVLYIAIPQGLEYQMILVVKHFQTLVSCVSQRSKVLVKSHLLTMGVLYGISI